MALTIAAYEKTGKGMLTGITRRTDLLEAREYLEEALKLDSCNASVLHCLCNVEYSLGLLLHTRNGRTAYFTNHYDDLKKLSPERARDFEDETDKIESWFS